MQSSGSKFKHQETCSISDKEGSGSDSKCCEKCFYKTLADRSSHARNESVDIFI